MKPLATIKCPFCQGKTNNERKTLYLYSTDTYWCARCKQNGVISDIDPSKLTGITPSFKQPKQQTFSYNNKGDRFSICKQRYSDSTKDVFQVKLADGTVTGHYIRYPNKQSNIEGSKGFCYRESYLEPSVTYRLVEGPYDCIYPNDVAVLGYPTEFQAKQLKWYKLILCPDGDVWTNKENAKRWFEPFKYHKQIVAVEYISGNFDPDEVTENQRKKLDFKQVKEWLEL